MFPMTFIKIRIGNWRYGKIFFKVFEEEPNWSDSTRWNANVLKERLQHSCILVNFAKFSRTPPVAVSLSSFSQAGTIRNTRLQISCGFSGAFLQCMVNYIFKVKNRNNRTRCEICSKLIIKTPERRHWRCSGVFIVNFEHISHLVLLFLSLTLNR